MSSAAVSTNEAANARDDDIHGALGGRRFRGGMPRGTFFDN